MGNTSKPLLVIVTGYSGAGKSVVIKALEDLTFYCIDNLPIDLLESTVDFFLGSQRPNLRYAIGMDVRSGNFSTKFGKIKEKIGRKIGVDTVFLTCSYEVLADRFNATRRKHPLIGDCGNLIEAIRREAASLSEVKQGSEVTLDTTEWSPHFLARCIEKRYADLSHIRNLYVSLISFGFKHGSIRPIDSIFDVRFLKNPYFDPGLKHETGLRKAVKEYVLSDGRAEVFLEKVIKFHAFLLPHYYEEGKHYFRIGIGCTGGKHRSVVVAEAMGEKLSNLNLPYISIHVSHRDINLK